MSPYLQRIWNHCVRRYGLRNVSNDGDQRVMSREQCGERTGGPKNYAVDVTRRLLAHHKSRDYIDLQTQSITRRFHRGRHIGDRLDGITNHISVNAGGTIRRQYGHEMAWQDGNGQRSSQTWS